MALGQAQISDTLIKNNIGAGTTAVIELCDYSTVNKWSRFKPVEGTFPTSSTGTYGLVLSNWSYTKPSTAHRMGDFRGYEHTGIMPVIYSPTANNTVPATLDPSGTITTATFGYKGNNTNNTTRIMPVDLGIQNYYIGIRYRANGGFWYYKTGLILSSLVETTGEPINIDVTVSVTGGVTTFANAPTTAVGTINCELVICSSQCTSWTTTAPATVYLLPSEVVNGVTVVNGYTFTVSGWIVLSNLSMYWNNSAIGSGNYQSSTVATSGSSVSTPSTAYYSNRFLSINCGSRFLS